MSSVSATLVAGDSRPLVKLVRHGQLLAVHARQPLSGPPLAVPGFGIDEAFFVTTHLAPSTSEIWRNGRLLAPLVSREGDVQLFDLRQNWRALVHPPFDTVNLRIPLALIAELSLLVPGTGFDPPAILSGRSDPTLLALSRALVPAFVGDGELGALFVRHVVEAATAHILATYGDLPTGRPEQPGQGLAPWQQRRAVQMLSARLEHELPLAEVAAACGLSSGHFTRAFKRSFGLPPHRWLMRERVRRAAALMVDTGQPLDQIAVACGFVDQSHLSRVFRRIMHLPPAAWRRAQREGFGSAERG